ncbi:MAG: hypothetical protein AAB336_11435 [Acidobacteriota bacterium]
MKYTLLILVFFTFVFSANAQSEKYIDVYYTSFNIFAPQVLSSNNINSLESATYGSVSDNNQKDSIINRNSDSQPTATLLINFKNISPKKIKSVSYLFEYIDGNKVFYKKRYTTTLNLLPNEFMKVRHHSQVISNYLANAKGVEKITISKIIFADKTSVKF